MREKNKVSSFYQDNPLPSTFPALNENSYCGNSVLLLYYSSTLPDNYFLYGKNLMLSKGKKLLTLMEIFNGERFREISFTDWFTFLT